MPTQKQETEQRVELFLERVFRQVKFPEHSEDETFLAGFYEKLREGVRIEPQTLGVWCWRLAPATGLASCLMCLTLVAGYQSARTTILDDGDDEAVVLLSENLGGASMVEAILHAEVRGIK